jgi:adenylylsulfate kinase
VKSGWAVWLTGLPASGKSTVARALAAKLETMGVSVQVIESDELRLVLTPRPTYSPDERETFYGAMVYIGTLLTSNGVNVIFDATANRRRWRDAARERIPRFVEAFVDTPLDVCMKRDPKGIYRRAAMGKAGTVPGKQAAYEAPQNPEVRLDDRVPAERAVQPLLEAMRAHGFDLPSLA